MTVLNLMAAALEQELRTHGVTGIDRAECREIVETVMETTLAAGNSVLPAMTPHLVEGRPEKGH